MGLALEKDFAFIGSVNAREDLDQGALAAPVFACEAVDLGGANGETDVGEGAHSSEALADSAHLDEVGRILRSDRLEAAGCGGHMLGRAGLDEARAQA